MGCYDHVNNAGGYLCGLCSGCVGTVQMHSKTSWWIRLCMTTYSRHLGCALFMYSEDSGICFLYYNTIVASYAIVLFYHTAIWQGAMHPRFAIWYLILIYNSAISYVLCLVVLSFDNTRRTNCYHLIHHVFFPVPLLSWDMPPSLHLKAVHKYFSLVTIIHLVCSFPLFVPENERCLFSGRLVSSV